MQINLKQIKAELEKLKTPSEKKKYLEAILKQVKDKNLQKEIEKLLAEVEKLIASEKNLEQKFGEKPEILDIKPNIEVITQEAEIRKYVPQKIPESKLEKEVGLVPLSKPAPESQKYIGQFTRQYENVQQTLSSLRDYFTQVLGIDLKTANINQISRREIEEHIIKTFNLGEGAGDFQRLQNYFNQITKPEDNIKKYKINY